MRYSVNFAVTRNGNVQVEADSIAGAVTAFAERGDLLNEFIVADSQRVVKVVSIDDQVAHVRFFSDGKSEAL